ncbi:HNH endonuclease signature motif containing protein [Lentzea aerocolonigenes]|uniref:HNH endonuclease signature motif containing protein n=1 Tax=Lentzea aerocolonigenes TaxID=68170 RepID=UPI000696E0C2|nr:HNH endonuclease signature motif containing protein [Lentzea aerocolonigenes]
MATLQHNTIHDVRVDAGARFESPCHIYLGGMNGSAYAQLPKPLHGTRLAHIAVWRENFGPLVPELQIDHRCRVRICVRVEHLEAVTAAENVRRRVVAGARRKRQAVHAGRLMIGGTCQSGRHEVTPADLSARRCVRCFYEALDRSKERARAQSLAAQRGDWFTFRRLANRCRPAPAVEFAQPAV